MNFIFWVLNFWLQCAYLKANIEFPFEHSWGLIKVFNCFLCLLLKHNVLELLFSPSSSQFFRDIGESELKDILQTIEQLTQFSYFENFQRRRVPQGLLDKCSCLFICISLKQLLSSEQTKTFLKWHDDTKTNRCCCNVLLWTSFCFLTVNQTKSVGMVSTNDV